MRTIIAGSRSVKHYEVVRKAIRDSGFEITKVVSGGALGADKLGEEWARDNQIPVQRFPADWTRHGKSAGPLRNIQMAENADALIAIWDGVSRGTKHMIEAAAQRGLMVHISLTR